MLRQSFQHFITLKYKKQAVGVSERNGKLKQASPSSICVSNCKKEARDQAYQKTECRFREHRFFLPSDPIEFPIFARTCHVLTCSSDI